MTRVLRTMVDHRFTSAHVSEYLNGELTQDDRDRVERHASVCPKCHALLASLRRMVATLPGLAGRPGPSVADGVLERLRREG